MRRFVLTTILCLVTLVAAPAAMAGAGGGPPPGYFVDQSKLPFTALPGATAYWGVHTSAGFRAEVPGNWNGSLVVWAHGFRGTGLELTVDNHPLRLELQPQRLRHHLRRADHARARAAFQRPGRPA